MSELVCISQHVETDVELPDGVATLFESFAADVEDKCCMHVKVSCTNAHGANIFGSCGIHVANVSWNGSGAYSFYDAWEYGEQVENILYENVRQLAAALSDDGQPHAR